MTISSSARCKIAKVARRLVDLRDESVPAPDAVDILVQNDLVSPQGASNADPPLASAIRRVLPTNAWIIADYLHASESNGNGDDALRFLAEVARGPKSGRASLSVIGIESLVLLAVVLVYSLFVLPVLESTYQSFGAELPRFTRLVFAVASPSFPVIWVAVVLALIGAIWSSLPLLFGPLIRPLDRLILALPVIGASIRRSNGEQISGWLGFGAPDEGGQRKAVEVARTWCGGILSRVCAAALAQANEGRRIAECLSTSGVFDREFQATMSTSDPMHTLKVLRARWRSCTSRTEPLDPVVAALTHVALGIVVAALVTAMYLPLFKLAALN